MSVVLIVEDEMLEQEFLKSVVSKKMLPEDIILTCESGIEAVEFSKKYRPDIIIMDILLTEMDGLSAIKEIRTFLPDACVTILSACSNFSYAQEAISLDVFEYLLKPVKPKVFEEVFEKMLDSIMEVDGATSNSINTAYDDLAKSNEKEYYDHYVIEEAIEYIRKNFKQKLTLETVASKVYMNPKYFSQVFKEETGTPFSSYVNNLKIRHACKLLETTDYPAYRISMECGFSDPSYFNRVFTRAMGITPIGYRKKYRKDKLLLLSNN